MNEVQVVCTVVSTSKKTDPDIAAMIGTSAALAISAFLSMARSALPALRSMKAPATC